MRSSIPRAVLLWASLSVGCATILALYMLNFEIGSRDKGRIASDVANLELIERGLKHFVAVRGSIPNQLLDVPSAEGSELRAVPRDPWGRDYVYQIIRSDLQKVSVSISSYGEDGRSGGTGASADMGRTIVFDCSNECVWEPQPGEIETFISGH